MTDDTLAKDAELASLRARLADTYVTLDCQTAQTNDLRIRLAQAEARIAEGREVIEQCAQLDLSDMNCEALRRVLPEIRRARAWVKAADQKDIATTPPQPVEPPGRELTREENDLVRAALYDSYQPVEPPAGADVEVGEWRKIFRTPSPTEPSEGEVEAAREFLREPIENLLDCVVAFEHATIAQTPKYREETKRARLALERAAAAFARARAPQDDGWRPIETAPKDGADILLWGDARLHGVPLDGPDDWCPDHCLGHWSNDGWSTGYDDWILSPSHWRPLPPPPARAPQEE